MLTFQKTSIKSRRASQRVETRQGSHQRVEIRLLKRVTNTGEALISAGFSFGLALCGRQSQHFQALPPMQQPLCVVSLLGSKSALEREEEAAGHGERGACREDYESALIRGQFLPAPRALLLRRNTWTSQPAASSNTLPFSSSATTLRP